MEPDDEHVPPNYRYWREYGGKWVAEYEWRKRHRPYYHVQELMLVDYFRHQAPCRVLEFGCGVGRHLRNLSAIAGLDVHGFDQSRAMAAGCLSWASPEWVDQHVRVGQPTGRLPYADGEFDVVYTSEVLIHVRPEDLAGILAELLRVCRGHILNLEPTFGVALFFEHDGCWNHDLVAAYADLGRRCQLLPSGLLEQTPYRVEVTPSRATYVWPPLVLDLYRRLEADLGGGIAEITAQERGAQEQLSGMRAERDAWQARASELERAGDRLRESLRTVGETLQLAERRRVEEAGRTAWLMAERDAFVQRARLVLGR
jgi:SAM-dependent methyltransferase